MSKYNQDYSLEIIQCECGQNITRTNMARHIKSETHEKRMKKIEDARIRADNNIIKMVEEKVDEKIKKTDEKIRKADQKLKDIDKRLRELEK